MKYLFILLMLPATLLAMGDRHLTREHFGIEVSRINSPMPRAYSRELVESSGSSEECVFDAVLDMLALYRKDSDPDISKHVRDVIEREKNSPLMAIPPTPDFVQRIMMESIQKQIDEIHIHNKNRISKRNAAIICGIVSSLMTLCSSIIVHYKAK